MTRDELLEQLLALEPPERAAIVRKLRELRPDEDYLDAAERRALDDELDAAWEESEREETHPIEELLSDLKK